ncbi:helix-turn-helix domain-containing protein [Streptomyces sp. NBC_00124]|uniref:helix-turn-helix domain-containing protein n=1 Tax=Streptomyces sp. NBC_00124 TaxID=2975662 RepID=UPI00224FA542|nr:helix-turn-helix domain-containing protein [Streptomyces sp. NBC_00124]MCX5365854.1 helix-turn-helix domain-containing protein [Streptomyces sp. NBC_00124]
MATKQSPRTPIQPADLNAPFFELREVAWLLKCSVDTVRREIVAGRLPCSQRMKGSKIRVSRADLDAYHEATRLVPLPSPRARRRPARAAA